MKLKRSAIFGVIIVSFLAIPLGYTSIGSITVSDGDRTGIVSDFHRSGIFAKTWEGELSVGGLDQGGIANHWHFSVIDPEVVEQLHEAEKTGLRHVLHYRKQLWSQSWKGQTPFFITKVEKLNQPK